MRSPSTQAFRSRWPPHPPSAPPRGARVRGFASRQPESPAHCAVVVVPIGLRSVRTQPTVGDPASVAAAGPLANQCRDVAISTPTKAQERPRSCRLGGGRFRGPFGESRSWASGQRSRGDSGGEPEIAGSSDGQVNEPYQVGIEQLRHSPRQGPCQGWLRFAKPSMRPRAPPHVDLPQTSCGADS
jgi:hypothetical protein